MTGIKISTDGACYGSHGPGGWAYVMSHGGVKTEASGAEASPTTNNRMDMQAAIEGLSALAEPCEVHVTTDSQYLANGMTAWLPGWKKMHWKTAAGKPVENRDLWEALDVLCPRHKVSWEWVQRSADPDDQRCKLLASQQAGIPEGFVPGSARRRRRRTRGRKPKMTGCKIVQQPSGRLPDSRTRSALAAQPA